jgi:hypothetical protein
MLELFDSLSLKSRALVVVFASLLTAIALSHVRSNLLKWLLSLGAPLLFAYCLYWTPVWLGTSSEEYSKWAPIFIIPWFAAGALASSVAVLFAGALRKIRR